MNQGDIVIVGKGNPLRDNPSVRYNIFMAGDIVDICDKNSLSMVLEVQKVLVGSLSVNYLKLLLPSKILWTFEANVKKF
jgi:hypothetical protein